MRRVTWIASSTADTDSPGVRTDPPMALIASQNPPAPSPSSKRPPLSTSIDAAALARTAGGRMGRLATSGNNVMRCVRIAIAVSNVMVSKNRH